MGNKVVIFFNIDKLVQEGSLFVCGYSFVFSSMFVCVGLFMGMFLWYYGMLGYGKVVFKYKYEMFQMLCDLGYYIFGIGKMYWFLQKVLYGFYVMLVDESGCSEICDFISDYWEWFQL